MSDNPAQRRWVKVRQADVFRTWHIVPINDGFDHDDDDCPCGPKTVPAKNEDGGIGWVLLHYSLDDRPLPSPYDQPTKIQAPEDTETWRIKNRSQDVVESCTKCNNTISFWHCASPSCGWCVGCSSEATKEMPK